LVAAFVAILMVSAPTQAAGPGGGDTPGGATEVRLEAVPGSDAPKVILTAKAAERLGIETGKVAEDAVARKLMVSGLVIPPNSVNPEEQPARGGFGGYGKVRVGLSGDSQSQQPAGPKVAPAANGEVWVLVTLSPGELERLEPDRPARLLQLDTRESIVGELWAQPSGIEPQVDLKRSMLSVYYKVPGKKHGLAVNNRMRVELQLAGSEGPQKVIPYSAVFYDAKGNAWAYVNGQPLSYQRQPIAVERVVGDLAVLSDGPAVGTAVVTVGAAMLHGCEVFKK
jgi:hypothetical protein